MFVDIENPKSPLKVANILTAYDKGVVIKGVRQPKEKLTPEVCFDILKSTNYPRCIRDMLTCIAKLPDDEQAEFKEVVLAAFDHRLQPTDILQLGQELAEKSGYGIDFAKLKKIKEGEYLFSDADARKCFMCLKSEFKDEDFSAYDKVVYLSDKKIQFGDGVKFPKNMDFPNSSDVSFYDKNGESACNFLGVQSIRFKDGAKVLFNHVISFPKDMDVANCDILYFKAADLKDLPQLDLKDGVELYLNNARTLSPLWDYSRTKVFSAASCDFWGFDELKFRKDAKVDLSSAYHLPKVLDVSECAEVELGGCDLSRYDEMTFGGKVTFHKTADTVTKMPKKLDLSHCISVWVEHNSADFSATKQIVFASREHQKRNNIPLPDDWKGEVIFADEQREADLNLAMVAKTKGGR